MSIIPARAKTDSGSFEKEEFAACKATANEEVQKNAL
jgi:hypothetical protein